MSEDSASNHKNTKPIDDLDDENVAAYNAADVKGGFNPQPEPPGTIRGFDPQPDPPGFFNPKRVF